MILKGVVVMPSIWTLTEGVEYKLRMEVAKVSCRPNFHRTAVRLSQCTQSNTFSASRKRGESVQVMFRQVNEIAIRSLPMRNKSNLVWVYQKRNVMGEW